MKSIKEIISSKRFFGGVDISNLMLIDHIWRDNFKEFSSMCEIYCVEKDVLVLKTKNSVIMSEIRNKKDFIVREINKYFKKKVIRDIKVIV